MASTFAYLLNAYFHQDWQLDSQDSFAVIRIFVEDENIDNVFALENEIKQLLANTEEQKKLFKESDYFNPKFYDFTNQEWLELALATIHQSLEIVKVNYAKIRHNAVLNAFYQEFSCYFQADEIPFDIEENNAILQNWVKDTFNRLTAKIDKDLLVLILDRMINQRKFYFNKIVSLATDFDLINDDKDWQLFKKFYIAIQNNAIKQKG